ncbi:MAG: ribonuclease HI family protein, partial [Chloroflexi bacterium]|nr:ribonuclease HI family protein [Chloroflexota bacterium]
SRGNPGPGAIGVWVEESGTVISQIAKAVGWVTNNEAEYLALIAGLEEAARLGFDEVEVGMDSELVVKQVRGEYLVRSHKLRPLWERVNALSRRFASFDIIYLPRGQNVGAHRLADEAIRGH